MSLTWSVVERRRGAPLRDCLRQQVFASAITIVAFRSEAASIARHVAEPDKLMGPGRCRHAAVPTKVGFVSIAPKNTNGVPLSGRRLSER